MKAIIFILFIGIALSYDTGAALNYARTYCKNYNPHYNNYRHSGGDCANFVSQCLKAGGFSFSGCSGQDGKGMLINVGKLTSCLAQKGWKKNSGSFGAGHPFFLKDLSHAMLAAGVSGNTIKIYGHTNDRCGDASISRSSVITYSP